MSSTSISAPSQVKETGQPRRARGILVGLVISAISVAIMLIALEIIGYAWEQKTAQGQLGWTLVASRRIDLELHGAQGQEFYLFEPGMHYEWEGVSVQINSRGLRTDEFEVPKPSNTYRILNLGDSVAFGWEVPLENTYGKLIESDLNAEGQGTRVEVINAAIPTWNLESERNFLVSEGLAYDPDLVLLDLTLVNDIYGRGPAISEGFSPLDWLRDNTYFWPFLTTQVRFLLANYRGPEAIPVLNPPVEESAYYPPAVDSPKWDEVWDLISEIREASEQAGAEFALAVFPTALQLSSSDHSDIPQRVLGERARDEGVVLFDFLANYEIVCREAPPGACEGFENLLFVDVWMHPSELGHQIAGDEIAAWIATQLPQDS